MKNNSPEEIWNKIKESENILLSLHFRPDGDSLGSCLAMKYLIERDLNKKVTLVSKDNLSDYIEDFSDKDILFNKSIDDLDLSKFDLLIFLDSAARNSSVNNFPENIFKINIDHHDTNPFYGNLNYVDAEAPSACSILLDLFKQLNVEFDNKLCKNLLLGIITDSGFFQNRNQPPKAMKQAAFLIETGQIGLS